MEIYEIIFSSPELKTVEDFVSEPGSPAFSFVRREEEFLAVKNSQGKTNREAILERYKHRNERSKQESKPAKQLRIKIGTKLAIPAQEVNRVGLLTQGIEVVSNNIPAFKAKMLAELEEREDYNPIQKTKLDARNINKGVLTELHPEVTVWIWCRSLSSSPLSEENEGQIFNITPFVTKVTTNVGKNGGNFQISLPPISCEFDKNENKWIIKKDSIEQFTERRKNNQQNDGFVASSELLTEDEDGNVRRSQFLFHNILSANDLVFIRFETLELEAQQRIDDNKDFIIDRSKIPGRIYDMIGLIDDNTQSVRGESGEVSININGRDLSKLFIDDGTYFYALEMSQGQLNFAGGSTQRNELMQRVFSDNALQYFGLYFNNSIENVLKFVIQQLSTIKIAPDYLFEHYGDRRNKKFNPERKYLQQSEAAAKQLAELKKRGVALISFFREKAGLVNNSANSESQQVEKIWRDLNAFFQQLRAKKARKATNSNTVGWSSLNYGVEEILANEYPNSIKGDLYLKSFDINTSSMEERELIAVIDKHIDVSGSNPAYKDMWKEEPASGIWSIIKLVIDEGITKRRIVDSSASSANGSLLNFIKKVCQEPFVEFYMDTYGDMFHLIARKPPTDRASYESLLNKAVVVEKESGEQRYYQPAIINIEVEDVHDEQLSYNDQEAISWYHLTPQANFIGNNSTYSLAYLPAIFLEEYAEIWGSRPMQIAHNYMPRLPLNPKGTDLDISELQAYEDIKYLVESNAYNPFTRKGQLKVNGDRRLKRGNLIRYKPTGEIFMIDDVQQNFQISESGVERTTTIQVSRGMLENFIKGVSLVDAANNATKIVTYFDIVNTEFPNFEDLKHTVTDTITEQIKVGTRKVEGDLNQDYNSFLPKMSYTGKVKNVGMSELNNLSFFAKTRFTDLINKINASGYYVIITSGYRSFQKQADLKKKYPGRAASAGGSKHNFGLAIDINIVHIQTGRQYGLKTSAQAWYGTGIPQLAKSLGFRWGGDSFGKNYDPVHFDLGGSPASTSAFSSYEEPIYETRTRQITRVEIDRSKVFTNFKVDKTFFNFFLRRRQNAKHFLKESSAALIEEVIIKPKN